MSGESIRESLEATMEQLNGAAEPAAAPAASPDPAAAGAPEPAAQAQAAAEATAGPDRDEHGRFKPKDTEGAQAAAPQEIEPQQPAEPEPQETETIRVPHALPAPLKAKFKELTADWRDAFVKQEDSIKAFKDEQAPKAARLNRYDEIIGPQLDRWRMAGLDEFSGIQTLIAAHNVLERNPVDGILHIARSYGVSAQQLAQGLGLAGNQTTGAQGQPAQGAAPDLSAALQPFLAPLQTELQTLKQQRQQDSQFAEAQKLSQAQAEVSAFASKPENMYFENVRADVARRLESGAATTLAEAYDQAVWASSEIRPLLIAEQANAASSKAAETAQRQKAQAAQHASGSVTGAPAPGAAAPRQSSSGNLREDLVAAWKEHQPAV